jgi:hypothetical protein
MDFTLTYRGQLRANSGPREKHNLRQHFHKQLQVLWTQVPLQDYRQFLEPPGPIGASIIEEWHGFRFAPLVSSRIHFVASLSIQFLRPEPPGTLVTQAGDLDNRIKTLLDALKVPHESTALPSDAIPGPDENPFFCLLQDDSLITGLSIFTDRLLEPVTNRGEVLLLVRVRTNPVKSLVATLGL